MYVCMYINREMAAYKCVVLPLTWFVRLMLIANKYRDSMREYVVSW